MKQIVAPIEEDITAVEGLIDEFLEVVPYERVKENYKVFFKVRGKYLRPTLLLLAAGAVNGNRTNFDGGLHRLGLILELLHSASLVHDDIVDEDFLRRGQPTINQVFGNKVAVLAGDTLFSYAFREAASYERDILYQVTSLALNMCMGELLQANGVESKEAYLQVIKGKTADFMAVACELGAKYVGADAQMVDHLGAIGLNLGLTYQMVDDRIDGDPNAMKYVTPSDVEESYLKTKTMIQALDESRYSESLLKLLDFMYRLEDN